LHYNEVLIEECSELIKEICKFKRTDSLNRDDRTFRIANIVGEMADVNIMCEQFIFIFGKGEMVKDIKKQKLLRLSRTIGKLKGE